ncbi:MAG: hypothetical protein JNJ60_16330, partial [Rhodocyclaceae bacterium]|nr:hypothetical protein [Rhodocyclaceae bacterium]
MPLADLLLAACGVSCVHLLATAGNFSEQFRDWSLPFERQQIDELPLTFAALFASMAWFAWRRWREAAALAEVASFERGEALAASRMREQLARHLIDVQEDERAALARELHDEFGQRCNAISVEAAWLRSAAGEKIDIAECAARIAAEADALGQVVRSRLRVLRPATLDLLGLRAALQEHCSAWSRRHGIA